MNNKDEEAESIFILYRIMLNLPGSELIQQTIKDYLNYIITVEFPSLLDKKTPPEGKKYISSLQQMIYSYEPQNYKDLILYEKMLSLFDRITLLRIERLMTATAGVPNELWWVLLLGLSLLIIMTWFILSNSIYHYILNSFLAAYIASAVVLIVLLQYPFSGNLAISPEAFEISLGNINNQ